MKSEDMTELLQKNEKRLDCTTVFISKCIHLIFDVRTSPLHVSYICIKKIIIIKINPCLLWVNTCVTSVSVKKVFSLKFQIIIHIISVSAVSHFNTTIT